MITEYVSTKGTDKAGLSIATPPQLFSPGGRSQPSVITRLARPPQRQAFGSSGKARIKKKQN